ncbi:TonB-dependent receptor [Sphingobacterium composti Ten et al. 2007 non Yoo et al. 2007]|uniref:TonB-dependent receptor n=1 Tax=Sphingobacterium composti TaxID=363260 RepID=UPI001F267BD4|nr:TonB-dependent receptor [Sphingobacterium composti Ten et al. 2007 non Yoo et al. 2007]
MGKIYIILKKTYFILLLLCAFNTVFAQQSKLTGKILDAHSNEAIAHASIAILDHNEKVIDGIMTDSKGTFEFDKVKVGSYILRVKFIGYMQKDTVINFKNYKSLSLSPIYLQIAEQELNAVNVTAQLPNQQQKSDRQVYKASQYQNAVGGTALDIVKNLPSVALDGNGQISMRGNAGLIVLINGKPSFLDPATVMNQIAANDVVEVEYISNPQAKFDPDGKAGIINLVTKKGTGNGLAWVLNLQGGLPSVKDYDNVYAQQRYGGDISLQYRKDKLAVQASANYLRNDNAGFRDGDVNTIIGNKKTYFPSQGERSFDKYNFGARINSTYTLSAQHEFNIGLLASRKYQDRVADIYYKNRSIDLTSGNQIHAVDYFNPNLQNKQGEFYLMDFSYQYSLNPIHKLKVGVAYEHANIYGSTNNGNIENKIDTVQWATNTYTNPLKGYRLSLEHNWKIGEGFLSSGYQLRNDKQNGDFKYYNSTSGLNNFELVPEFTGQLKANNKVHALFSQYEGKSDRLNYALGLRYEYYERDLLLNHTGEKYPYDIHQLYPTISLKHNLDKSWAWRFAASRRVHRNNNFELNPIPEREHSETLERGDPELLPEFVTNVELGLEKMFNKGSVFTNAYYQHSKNPLQRVNSVYADTILHRVFTNADFSDRWGAELGGELKISNIFKFNAGVNIYQYRISGKVLDYEEKLSNQDWVYSFNSGLQATLPKLWSAGLHVNYISERPTVQGFDSRFFTPHLNVSKGFMQGAVTAQLQWRFIELGNWGVNEQRITTMSPDFFTTTNYIYEKNVFLINFNINLKKLGDLIKLPKSEFGEKEF